MDFLLKSIDDVIGDGRHGRQERVRWTDGGVEGDADAAAASVGGGIEEW